MNVPLYDGLSADYDRFVHWPKRLAAELPFIERQLVASGARRVLDVACGTGQHAIALARQGYQVTGADLSAPMIARAQENAAIRRGEAPYSPDFVVAGFGELATKVGGSFDALLCLGNSLPHVLAEQALQATLADFAAVLRPGGLLLVQNRNLDAVAEHVPMARRARWMPLQAHRDDEGREWLFLRFYDLDGPGNRAAGTLTFNLVTLQREGTGEWTQRVQETTLRPWLHDELTGAIAAAGFEDLACYGDMGGMPFAADSPNLIITARRKGGRSEDLALQGERRLLDEGA